MHAKEKLFHACNNDIWYKNAEGYSLLKHTLSKYTIDVKSKSLKSTHDISKYILGICYDDMLIMSNCNDFDIYNQFFYNDLVCM